MERFNKKQGGLLGFEGANIKKPSFVIAGMGLFVLRGKV